MKTIIAATLLCSALSPMGYCNEPKPNLLENISEPTHPKKIHVLLEKDAPGALLEIKGPYYIHNPYDGSRVASGLLGKRFMIHELESGLKWGEEFAGIHQLVIKPRSPETKIFVNGIQYSGAIAIYGCSGIINVVNEIAIEDFVKAILSPQFSAPLETEVLSALAILARTDAYYRTSRSADSFWHVAASDIGYQGSALIVENSPVDRAVDTTKHLILVHPKNGQSLPFATHWTEHSAGKTAAYQTIFRKNEIAPTRGVDAPHAALSKQDSKWSYSISKKTLSELLDVSMIQSVELFTDSNSNKVYGFRINNGKSHLDFDFITLQNAVGKKHLLSNDFTVTMKGDSIIFNGFGKGHGVGLCLYSASALAQNGENALKILNKFYPETYLYNLNATIPSNAR